LQSRLFHQDVEPLSQRWPRFGVGVVLCSAFHLAKVLEESGALHQVTLPLAELLIDALAPAGSVTQEQV
jgi:hypothetical protein